jgi:hypothetical protein
MNFIVGDIRLNKDIYNINISSIFNEPKIFKKWSGRLSLPSDNVKAFLITFEHMFIHLVLSLWQGSHSSLDKISNFYHGASFKCFVKKLFGHKDVHKNICTLDTHTIDKEFNHVRNDFEVGMRVVFDNNNMDIMDIDPIYNSKYLIGTITELYPLYADIQVDDDGIKKVPYSILYPREFFERAVTFSETLNIKEIESRKEHENCELIGSVKDKSIDNNYFKIYYYKGYYILTADNLDRLEDMRPMIVRWADSKSVTGKIENYHKCEEFKKGIYISSQTHILSKIMNRMKFEEKPNSPPKNNSPQKKKSPPKLKFQDMNSDVLYNIIEKMNYEDIKNLCMTDKGFNELCKDKLIKDLLESKITKIREDWIIDWDNDDTLLIDSYSGDVILRFRLKKEKMIDKYFYDLDNNLLIFNDKPYRLGHAYNSAALLNFIDLLSYYIKDDEKLTKIARMIGIKNKEAVVYVKGQLLYDDYKVVEEKKKKSRK